MKNVKYLVASLSHGYPQHCVFRWQTLIYLDRERERERVKCLVKFPFYMKNICVIPRRLSQFANKRAKDVGNERTAFRCLRSHGASCLVLCSFPVDCSSRLFKCVQHGMQCRDYPCLEPRTLRSQVRSKVRTLQRLQAPTNTAQHKCFRAMKHKFFSKIPIHD